MGYPNSSFPHSLQYPPVSIRMSRDSNTKWRARPGPVITSPDRGCLSTPAHEGSASQAISSGFEDLKVQTVKTALARDIEENEKVDVAPLLSFLLSQCVQGDSGLNGQELLSSVLGLVIPICNKHETIADAKEYCKKVNVEEERYAPFVKLCNNILLRTGETEFPGLGGPSDLDILFHCNDPYNIQANHRNDPYNTHANHSRMSTLRRPDVVVTRVDTLAGKAQKTHASANRQDTNLTQKRSHESFEWADLLGVIEFKLKNKSCDPPPKQYIATLTNHILPVEDIHGPLCVVPTNKPSKRKSSFPSGVGPGLREKLVNWYKEIGGRGGVGGIRSEGITGQQDNPNLHQRFKRPAVVSSAQRLKKYFKSDEKKRKTTHIQSLTSSDRKTLRDSDVRPCVQNALYGAEMLCRGPYASHTITLLILDDVVWIWWFDRQGAIQSAGINFVQDLPYFAVLLVAFQRFGFANWGIMDQFRSHEILGCDQFRVDFPEQGLVVAAPPADYAYGYYSLRGRCTRVYEAVEAVDEDKRPLSTHDFPEIWRSKVMLKMYWPEESRENEAKVLQEVTRVGKSNDAVRDHIPGLIAFREYPYSTGNIRKLLGLRHPNMSQSSRVFRSLLLAPLEALHPDTHGLSTAEFLKGWKECFICHFHLWVAGIEHGDISLGNLLWDPKKKVGVLGDFDLAIIRGAQEKRGMERTGTVPFMALDLLTKEYFDGNVRRLYRHDVESFVWIIVWLATRKDQDLNDMWTTSDYKACRGSKASFVLQDYAKVANDNEVLSLLIALISWVRSVNHPGLQKSSTEMVFEEVRAIICDNWRWD